MPTDSDVARVRDMTDRRRYEAPLRDSPRGWESVRGAPAAADTLAVTDGAMYRYYVDHSCDLTMRGGTTSGVVYPLAVCALARHYVFRSVGGASAGAIAASTTAAAELGRTVNQPAPPGDASVQPGFAGLAEVIDWLSPADVDKPMWRLAQLFQPGMDTRSAFRVVAASMQSAAGTKRSKARCLAVALLAAVSALSRILVAVLLAIWLLGPVVAIVVLSPQRWAGAPDWAQWTVVGLGVALVGVVVRAIWHSSTTWRKARQMASRVAGSAARTRIGIVAAALAPLVALAMVVAGDLSWAAAEGQPRPIFAIGPWPVLAYAATVAVAVLWWLTLTLAVLMSFIVMYGMAMTRLLQIQGRDIHFGLVPGAEKVGGGRSGVREWLATRADRLSGMPKRTGVPPLSVWLADRIDDLAGIPCTEPRHTLTFGDLWLGRMAAADQDRDALLAAARDPRQRVVNLALMTTNLSQGRPYRLPFLDHEQTAILGGSHWLFCPDCLTSALPARVIHQMTKASSAIASAVRCPTHRQTCLVGLPQPWDVPVVVATRLSLALPGLIAAVPLYTDDDTGATNDAHSRFGSPQWFSDGGITSNFPIHFFDSLLPRWPTFGLNLQSYPPGGTDQDVWIPLQDTSATTEPWTCIGSATSFLGAILDTFQSWRDTMQSALPGFRGRIAHVRQHRNEGGTNLFMTSDTIRRLALRGNQAGEQLRQRFTVDNDGDAQTQTDRYRWIRMRLAMRKYRELADEIATRTSLYSSLANSFQIPADLAGWFDRDAGPWPAPDPEAPIVAATIAAFASLATADTLLKSPLRGTPPLDPNLRLTPPE
jgi:predicted acylesterase/phospholipase RssA